MMEQSQTSPAAAQLDVFSCGIGPLPESICQQLATVDVLVASRSLLAACANKLASLPETRAITAHARDDARAALAAYRAGRRVAILASGDALYHGIGSTLAELALPTDNIVYHPGITAFQALFHRLGLAWSEASLFYAHAGSPLPIRAFVEAPLSVIYAGSRFPAHALAKAILTVHPASSSRAALVAEKLGFPDERLVAGSLEELAQACFGPTSMLLLHPHMWGNAAWSAVSPVLALGLPETCYLRENNLITAADVRAVALARLRLPAWGVLWDIGAGSGSVGLEAAALRPKLHVVAVERHPQRAAHIACNRTNLGVVNHIVHTGDALSLIQNNALPAPDRIFIGGGGAALPELLEHCLNALQPNGLLVVSAVTLESLQILMNFQPQHRQSVCRLDVAVEQPLAAHHHHLKPQNTIYLFTFHNGMHA